MGGQSAASPRAAGRAGRRPPSRSEHLAVCPGCLRSRGAATAPAAIKSRHLPLAQRGVHGACTPACRRGRAVTLCKVQHRLQCHVILLADKGHAACRCTIERGEGQQDARLCGRRLQRNAWSPQGTWWYTMCVAARHDRPKKCSAPQLQKPPQCGKMPSPLLIE